MTAEMGLNQSHHAHAVPVQLSPSVSCRNNYVPGFEIRSSPVFPHSYEATLLKECGTLSLFLKNILVILSNFLHFVLGISSIIIGRYKHGKRPNYKTFILPEDQMHLVVILTTSCLELENIPFSLGKSHDPE